MKKLLLMAITTIIALCAIFALSLTAFASPSVWKYTISNGEVTITEYNPYPYLEVLIIPSEIDGYRVTSIGGSVFRAHSELTSITIPEGVTSIGYGAFESCSSLMNITIGNNVTSIGWNAFKGCSNLTSITIPNSVTNIGLQAFNGCSSLTTVLIGDGMTSIGVEAFYGCSSLTNVTIGNNVTSIERNAFDGCSSLISITIPDSVTTVGDYAFSGCSALASITVGNGVTSIGDGAFSYCLSLSDIEIPECVKSIGEYAFNECRSLTSIEIPASVTSIGDDAFYNCNKLESITVDVNNPNYSSDEHGVLFNKNKTKLIKAPYKIIGDYTIPNTVTIIEKSAFSSCFGLTSVIVPASVAAIGNEAFYYCTGIKAFTVDEDNSNYSFDEQGVLFNKDKTELVQAFCGMIKGSYAVPANVKSICDGSFASCSNLTKITIPASVTTIGDRAFYNCSKLESITVDVNNSDYSSDARGVLFNKDKTELIKAPQGIIGSYVIPSGVTSIFQNAFINCHSITDVTIPKSVAVIGMQSFDFCKKLTDVYYEGNENEWNEISLGWHGGNEWKNAAIHYNSLIFQKIGDISGDGELDIDDAVLLFRHSMLPDTYPISYSGSLDFNSDGKVDIDDAVLLFRHSMLPDLYPLG